MYYIDGMKRLKWTWWYENGQKEAEYHFKGFDYGTRDGRSTNWDENGQIEAVAIFKDDECISGDYDYFKDL